MKKKSLGWCLQTIKKTTHLLTICSFRSFSDDRLRLPLYMQTYTYKINNKKYFFHLFQGIQQRTYDLKSSVKLFKDLNLLTKDEAFRNATTIYPVTSTDDFYRLHAYFSKVSGNFFIGTIDINGFENEFNISLPRFNSGLA